MVGLSSEKVKPVQYYCRAYFSMQKGVFRTMLNLHHLISIKIATEKMEIVFCNFRFIILKWVLILHHSEQTCTRSHLTTFYVPSSLSRLNVAVPQACRGVVLGLDGRWRVASCPEGWERTEVDKASA